MKSVVYARRLKTARGFLFVTCLYITALLSIVTHSFPYQTPVLYAFLFLTVFYLALAGYWYIRAWQWKKFRERHPGIDNTDLKELLRQATRRLDDIPVRIDQNQCHVDNHPTTSTLSDAFSGAPAPN